MQFDRDHARIPREGERDSWMNADIHSIYANNAAKSTAAMIRVALW